MEFNTKDHQFTEVDEDLRRIGEREVNSKKLCPFGSKCYRKNVQHLQEYRHPSDLTTGATHKHTTSDKTPSVKKGKITDYFGQKPNTENKLLIKTSKDYNFEIIGHDSDNEIPHSTYSSDNKTTKLTNSSSVRKTNGKEKKNRKRVANDDNDNDFDDNLKAIIKDNDMTTKRRNDVSHSPKITKLQINSSDDDISCIVQQNDIPIMKNDDKVFDVQKSDKSLLFPVKPKITPKEFNEMSKDLFLVKMPKDFFYLWQFCKTIKPHKPEDALIECLNLRLVGPYDLMTGRIKKDLIKNSEQILCHWRYYYDLPEMQTIIASNRNGYHLAYFRDTPDDDNPVVVSNNGDNCIIEGIGDNIFAAIYSVIMKMKSKGSPNKTLNNLESKIKEFCTNNKIKLIESSKLRQRKIKINSKTFNSFGIVVPHDEKTDVGYRPLPQSDTQLKKLLASIMKLDVDMRNDSKSLSELKEIIQLVSYASDECDFGMGLELGVDLFSYGEDFFHKSILHLLSNAYDLLKRVPFARILRAHINNRRKGFQLDCL
ncbi:histone PARylation factor 1-like [Oppia nitens]|uniref:histone PARylation factor 1-like n=1 Tax=Oppia nitens TaxID=1686743 RepID=UPI0023DB1819|nr:histone PARylation factor 1-like [Oppia nitens]